MDTKVILDSIVLSYQEILKDNLTGVYLHGSLAMNCFNSTSSDIDFLVLVKEELTFEIKRKLIKVLLELSEEGPQKGFEMSVILEAEGKNLKYPTPFILHYSNEFKDKYLKEHNFICGDATDYDLAAHIVITRERGICLFGKPIYEAFEPVPKEYYISSIVKDIEGAKGHIIENSVYIILNLCRVLYYLREEAICSKKEGGQWGFLNLPEKYKTMIKLALVSYNDSNQIFQWENDELISFAEFMLSEIMKGCTDKLLI